MSSENLAVVKEIYAAFGRGDVCGIVDRVAESVEWEYGGSSEDVPWLRPRSGRAGALEFFSSLSALDLESFEPKLFLEGPDLVVVLIDVVATVKATGKRFREEDEVHIWHFDEAHRVSRFRHRVDTRQQLAAFRPAG